MARRKLPEEHDNHERWLVSYADFITLLFAFFVVMYAISSVNEGKYRVLSDSLVNAFRSTTNTQGVSVAASPRSNDSSLPMVVKAPKVVDPATEKLRQENRQKMRSMADEIKRVLEPLVAGGQVRVTEGVHGISVEINASVLFAPGEAQLGPDAVRALRAVAQVVANGEFPITVEGHTDTLPINTPSFPSNWELSAVRSSSVVRLFVNTGVDPRRLTAAGYGDQRPIADNATPEGRARNRRVTILIESMLPEVTTTTNSPLSDESGPRSRQPPQLDGALGTPANIKLVPQADGSSGP